MTIEKDIIGFRRELHSMPELSGEEFKTAQFIEKQLKSFKIPFKRIAKTGVVGLLKSGRAGKTIGLRADIDALPIQEENNVFYKSKNKGIMHACGHDNHVAIMLGVAKILSGKKDKLKGNVKFIFQPSEEMSSGAQALVEAGVMKNPKVDMILGVHVNSSIASGKIGIKYGAMMANVDRIIIEITGSMTHGAYPHLGKDAMVAAAEFILSAQTIVSREINPLEPAVVTIGKISGGDSYNIIASKVLLEATARTLSKENRKYIQESIYRKLKAIEIAHQVKTKLTYYNNANAVINDFKTVQFCQQAAQEFYGKNNVVLIEEPSMGGEDFSEYMESAPGNFMYIGTRKNKDTSYPWHNERFNVDENALPKAAKYIAFTTEKFLNK